MLSLSLFIFGVKGFGKYEGNWEGHVPDFAWVLISMFLYSTVFYAFFLSFLAGQAQRISICNDLGFILPNKCSYLTLHHADIGHLDVSAYF